MHAGGPIRHELEGAVLEELSGMAASTVRSDIFWAINDSGNAPALHAIGGLDRVVATVRIADASNIDWEDIASFLSDDGVGYLLVADTGDNAGIRDRLFLYLLREPEETESGYPSVVLPEAVMAVRFPGGIWPDIEAVAVDARFDTILLLAKDPGHSALYRVPLSFDGSSAVVTAEPVEGFTLFPDNLPADFGHRFPGDPYARLPSAMEISHDGERLLILTYGTLLLHRRESDSSWAELLGLGKKAAIHRLPRLKQAEAAAFCGDGTSLVVGSEALPTILLEWDMESLQGGWE